MDELFRSGLGREIDIGEAALLLCLAFGTSDNSSRCHSRGIEMLV